MPAGLASFFFVLTVTSKAEPDSSEESRPLASLDERRLASLPIFQTHTWNGANVVPESDIEYRDQGTLDFYSRLVRASEASDTAPTASAGGMLPVMRTGRSDKSVSNLDVSGMIPILRSGRSDGLVPQMRTGRMDSSMSSMVPIMRTGRSDGLVPLMRTGRSSSASGELPLPVVYRTSRSREGMIPILRPGRSTYKNSFGHRVTYPSVSLHDFNSINAITTNHLDQHDRRRKRSIKRTNLNETNLLDADAGENVIIAWLSSSSNDDRVSTSSNCNDKAYINKKTRNKGKKSYYFNDDVSMFNRQTRQLIPNPRVGRRSDPNFHRLLFGNFATFTSATKSVKPILGPYFALTNSIEDESGPIMESSFDPIDLQVRAVYIPRFGKRGNSGTLSSLSSSSSSPANSAAALVSALKRASFQPRIGRSGILFQPRLGRASLDTWSDDSLPVDAMDETLMDTRSLRASFQPRIGRSVPSSKASIASPSSSSDSSSVSSA